MAHAVFDWRQWLDSAAESRIFYLTIETHQEMIEIVKRDFFGLVIYSPAA